MVRDGSAAERRFEGRLRSLRSAGHRITAQRRAVLRALALMGCACGAEDVHARARRIYPRLGLVTVYRTLAALVRRSEEHTSELQSHSDLVCRLLLEKKNSSETAGTSFAPRRAATP